jgi:exodeoxyribonuclease V gamma subunit
MIEWIVADDVRPLAAALADVLAEPLPDPMVTEWVAVPTEGMRRWLRLELARRLGATGRDDGIVANVDLPFPGRLRQVVIDAERAERGTDTADPWAVAPLTWTVYSLLRGAAGSDRYGPLAELPPGATWFGRARRVADLFDRYATRRPELLERWARNEAVDTRKQPLDPARQWQFRLWCDARARIDDISPPERFRTSLERVQRGDLAVDLPERIALFGLTTLPTGDSFLDLLAALSVDREVRAFLLDPAPAVTEALRARTLAAPPASLRRADDTTADLVAHPLLRSWGRPYRERTVLLAASEASRGTPAPRLLPGPARPDPPTTLLHRLQHDLRHGTPPAGDFVLGSDDRSVQVHACHGTSRQVEVLRDAILHLLADDPTLTEDDVVVLCPTIEEYAPLISAGFGPSAGAGSGGGGDGPPRLRYRVTDRGLRDDYPLFAAFEALLALVAGRAGASELVGFVSLPAVRTRFGFDDAAVASIAEWTEATHVRWGLDADDRARFGFDPPLADNSWRAGLDRLLTGVAVVEADLTLGPGGVAPHPVEGGAAEVAGALADLVARLAALRDRIATDHSLVEWGALLVEAAREFLDPRRADDWQAERLARAITEAVDDARLGAPDDDLRIGFAEVRALVAERLGGAPRRSELLRGGVTVTSLTPLRWLPYRVVCILGFDEAGTGPAGGDGDDLTAVDPLLGDRDPRAETRQALLEAVLAAGDHLVVTRTGHSVRTNQEVPLAVTLAELRDTIVATLAPGSPAADHPVDPWSRIETRHPHQPFDARVFVPGALGHPQPWSFDPVARAGAAAVRDRATALPEFLPEPLEALPTPTVLVGAQVNRFLRNPVHHFFRERLGAHVPDETDTDADDEFALTLGGLDAWHVADRLINARCAGLPDDRWSAQERASGALPPGPHGDDALTEIRGKVDEIFALARTLGVDPLETRTVPVEVTLGDGTRIVANHDRRAGHEDDQPVHPDRRPGPARISYSSLKDHHYLEHWIELMVLCAARPDVEWRSVRVCRLDKKIVAVELVPRLPAGAERAEAARHALGTVIDLMQRATREPLPLFPEFSRKLAEQPDADLESAWHVEEHAYRKANGAGDDVFVRLAFGDADVDDILDLPARDDDPGGDAESRAERFAEVLWGTVDATAVDLRAATADDIAADSAEDAG